MGFQDLQVLSCWARLQRLSKSYELVCSYSGNPAPFPMVGYKWLWAIAKEDLLEYARVVFLKGCYAEGVISCAKHDELCRKSIEELVALEAVGAF